ncbi:ketopantoate reductase family protein [Sporomusa aerivorans]|uniref:ketopantoate reductase family protein n=1 Tax=Sporomusa aerivorans TaxID=204936 RepID=UPI00352A99F0
MYITVIGAGATGGYFGARLAASGLPVTFLVRPNRATQMKADGLVVKSVLGDLVIRDPQIALDTKDIPHCDLVVLCLKNYQLEACFPQLKDLVRKGARILPILNGVEHFESLAKEFGKESVIAGNCKINATLDSHGTILHTNKLHKLIFGEIIPTQIDFCLTLQQILSKANLEIVYSQTIWEEIWSKYAFITVFSGVTTAGNLTTDLIYQNEATRQMFRRALDEMTRLAGVCGVNLPDNFVSSQVESLAKYPKGTTTSMHQDLKKGLPLEVESLQGAAIRLATKKNLELPIIETLYGLIKPYELGL